MFQLMYFLLLNAFLLFFALNSFNFNTFLMLSYAFICGFIVFHSYLQYIFSLSCC